MSTPSPIKRTARQIVDAAGKPYQTSVTSNVWVGGENVFAAPTENNKVQAFTTGEDYFANLIAACQAATSEICIAGWQINWDALLASSPTVRLYDLLRSIVAANKNVIINVMPWSHSVPVETYDGQTATVLQQINTELNTRQIRVVQSPSYAKSDNRYFAHHQKEVVVDRKIAFVGGMDLAYGRFDDNAYRLFANADGREAMNRYNSCVTQVGTIDPSELVNPDLITGPLDVLHVPLVRPRSNADQEISRLRQSGHWQVKYKEAGFVDKMDNAKHSASDAVDLSTLDPATQPRMPWQDVHCRIEGPAVSDLLRNFVQRWNIEAKESDRLPIPAEPRTYAAAGQAHVQVLRSVPAEQCAAEKKAMRSKPKSGSTATQDNIHQAMLLLIEKSRRFIYIENQFFVSAFGREAPKTPGLSPAAQFIDTYGGQTSQNLLATAAGMASSKTRWHPEVVTGPASSGRFVDTSDVLTPPKNEICAALIKRIARAIKDKRKPAFHVYITLPVHPEGTLSTASIATQVYWTMQTLVFGSHSLLNGIRRALKARELEDKNDTGHERAFEEGNTEYESIPIERCFDYVTLLNLRNWAKLGDRYVTEQVYVHSKLMIVDDMYALLGSANINDRSLLGDRDSELAVLVVDGATERVDVNGVGSHKEVRVFAHDLRVNIWKKLFGLASGVRPANGLADAIAQPGKPDSWRLIQKQANANAALYEAAFPWVPKSWTLNRVQDKVPASILPPWDSDEVAPLNAKWGKLGRLMSPMPFENDFWLAPRHKSAATHLEQVEGFITTLPAMWTRGENNRFEYPTTLVTEIDSPVNVDPDGPQLSQAGTPDPASWKNVG